MGQSRFKLIVLIVSIVFAAAFTGCKKDNGTAPAPTPGETTRLSYGDSVFFTRKDQPAANLIKPVTAGTGTYSAFPEGLQLDTNTGAINLEKSEPGLRYRISFKPAGVDSVQSTDIVISGINYLDNLHYLSENDSILSPVYNANPTLGIPAGEYDLGSNKVAIDPATGKINLKKSLRNGLFSDDPQNDEWRKITIDYKINDQSGGMKSRIEMILYYYNTVSDIPSNVSGIMRAHKDLVFGINNADIPVTNAAPDQRVNSLISLARPRPPCVIIVGR